MPAYDAVRFDPPAPVARVNLSGVGGRVDDVDLLIDSGAALTLLPQVAAKRVGEVVADKTYELQAFEGTTITAEAVDLTIEFLGKRFRGRFVMIDAEEGILGRDVLANLAITLDGPGSGWGEVVR